ncbi:MAG: PAS domain S-box-containing protein [Vicingaceae bacterium]|jgi:PAS domain S-box-containing protein
MKLNNKPTYQELVQRIDALESEIHRIQNEGEQKIPAQDYKHLFDNAPISIWNEDFTLVYEQLDQLRKLCITDIKSYLKQHPEVLFSLLSKLKVTSVNKATLKLFKAESGQELLQNIQHTFGEGANKVSVDLIAAIWNKEQSFTAEVNYKTLQGVEFAALFSVPIPQTTEEQQTVPITIQSIQKLKEAELARKESLLKLEQAQKIGHIGSWEWEWETDHAIWSDEMYRIYGVKKEDFKPTSQNVSNAILQADKYKMELAIAKLFKGEVADSFEFRIVRPNNEIRDVSIIALQISEGTIFGITQDITDRKKIERELDQAQTLAKVGSWLFNPATKKLKWSNEMFQIWGLDVRGGAPEYDTLLQRIHPDDVELWNTSVANATNQGVPYNIEHRVCLPNGEEKIVRGICQPVLGINGEVVSLAGSGQDITEQKKIDKQLIEAKEKAEESKDYLNNIINNIGDPVFVKDDQFRMVLVNNSFCRLLGFPKHKLIGRTMAEDIPANQMEGFIKIDLQVLNDGQENLNEEVITNANGEELTIITRKSRYVDEHNNRFIIGTIRDITESRVIQREIDTQNEKLNNLNNALNKAQRLAKVGSWSFNTSNQKSEWSNEMFLIWGFELSKLAPDYDTIIGKVYSEDLNLFINAVENAIVNGTPYDIEHRISLSNGEQKIVRAICQPVVGIDGKVVSLVGTSQDITTQKQFEKSQVKNHRLKAMGEMSSSIAHDFNNSLQEMMGNLEIVKLESDLSRNTIKRLNTIGSIIADVADRVSALQKFSDAEHADKNAKTLDLNTLIEESLSESRPLWKDAMEKEGVKINVSTDFGKIPKILSTSGELKAAIYNLVKNSIEAMPEGGNLTIKTGLKAEGVYARFIDTGLGMTEETKLKLFDPFFSTKGFELGRGLGMSGVYGIVNKYKGDIAVTSSELGKGTTIEIVFPISNRDEIKVLTKEEPQEKKLLRVLWVDDDFLITKSSCLLIESLGHQCDGANSGQKALAYLDEKTYDFVFTDIGMPKMNGWELADAIRSKLGNKLKIIVVTGWEVEEQAKKEHGIDFVLQKPFTLDQLKKILLV